MQIRQLLYQSNKWKDLTIDSGFQSEKAQLVLAFGQTEAVQKNSVYVYLRNQFPEGQIILASTAGEILGKNVFDNSISVTAVQLEKTQIRTAKMAVQDIACSFNIGKELMNTLNSEELSFILVISDGTVINGSNLLQGFNEMNTRNVPISGGLAGDGEKFRSTYVGLNTVAEKGTVVAVGFYGHSLKTTHASRGGWDSFGPEKTITRSADNILYELNDKSALELYKEYLGPYANELPASSLLFPLALSVNGKDEIVVRTILSLNEEDQSMVFAGNMPEGSKVRLMKSNFDKLRDATSTAAQSCFDQGEKKKPELALLISCVGRKLILQERSDEEVIAAQKIFGDNTFLTGFYSYGEISPSNPDLRCALHNQTMTITTLSES